MKRMGFLCASPASAAICTSQDHRSMVRQGIRPQNRPNPKPYKPCTSLNQIPFNPKSLYDKTRKSSANETAGSYRKSSADIRDSSSSSSSTNPRADFRRRSSADVSDVKKNPYSSSRYLLSDTPYIDWIEPGGGDHQYATALVPNISHTPRPRRSSTKTRLGEDGNKASSNIAALGWVSEPEPGSGLGSKTKGGKPKERRSSSSSSSSSSEHYRVPAASSRKPSSSSSMMVQEWVSESGNYVSSLVPTTRSSNTKRVTIDASGSPPPLKSSSSARSRNQVVVLRVSIHCKGCEGKVRKHISKMEGVTSFNIDLATKKVTIIGDVTPLSVLASISKVKNAQIWPSSTTSSPPYDPSPRWST